jgi:hypothetical protein
MSGYSLSCAQEGRLICFEPGVGDPLPDYELPGAYAFVTSASGPGDLGSWPEAGPETGLAAGDAICQDLAEAAGLPDPSTFVAWLSTASVDAFDRLPASTPFKRVDGVRIAQNRTDLTAASNDDLALRVPLNVTEAGVHVNSTAATGTRSDGTFSPNVACSGWTSDSDQDLALYGRSSDSTGRWTESSATGCQVNFHLYCFSSLVTIFRDDFELGDATRWSNY